MTDDRLPITNYELPITSLRILSLFLSLSLFLAACSSPTPTVAPTAAVTVPVRTAAAAATATPAAPTAVPTSAPASTAASATPATGVSIGYVFGATSTPGVLGAIQAIPGFGLPVQSAAGGPTQPVGPLAA